MTLGAPQPLTDQHDCAGFACGSAMLDTWLNQRALRNQTSGASRTFVVCDSGRVVAYYALASSAVAAELATGRLRRNMPDPIPVVVLARLAVDRSYQGLGLSRSLMQDAGRGSSPPPTPSAFAACWYMPSTNPPRRSTSTLGLTPRRWTP